MALALLLLLVVAQPAPEPGGSPQVHIHGPHDFKDTAKYVAMFEDPERAAHQKPAEVIAALHIAEGAKVADIGAGSGYFTLPFARAVGETGAVYAIDIEPGMIEHLRKRAA